MKVSRFVTHVKRLRDAGEHLAHLLERIEPLAASGKLGPLLWQLPPTFERDDDRLAQALAEIPDRLRSAIEFRHESWFADDVVELLRRHSTALVLADRPGSRPLRNDELTADFVYMRFHHGAAVGAATTPDRAPGLGRRIPAMGIARRGLRLLQQRPGRVRSGERLRATREALGDPGACARSSR